MMWLAVELLLLCWIQLPSPDFSFNEGAWLLGAKPFFHKQMDCGLEGDRAVPHSRERQGEGWICNKLVKIELLPDVLDPEMKERNLLLP